MTTTPADARAIAVDYDLPFPPAKVWRTLTEPELLARWVMANDMQPLVGHRFTFRSEPTAWWDGIVHCEVLELVPQERLRYTWQSGPEKMPLDTVVTWTLHATPTGTRLSLLHSGFSPQNTFAFNGAGKGWEHNVTVRMREVLGAL